MYLIVTKMFWHTVLYAQACINLLVGFRATKSSCACCVGVYMQNCPSSCRRSGWRGVDRCSLHLCRLWAALA